MAHILTTFVERRAGMGKEMMDIGKGTKRAQCISVQL
jgi:hypothetical protein